MHESFCYEIFTWCQCSLCRIKVKVVFFSLIHIECSWFSLHCHLFLYYSLSEEKLVAAHMGRPCLLELDSKPSYTIVLQYIFIWDFSILQSSLFVHTNKCEHYFLLLVDMNESYSQYHNLRLCVEYRILCIYLSFIVFSLTILTYYFQLNLHQLFWLATILLHQWIYIVSDSYCYHQLKGKAELPTTLPTELLYSFLLYFVLQILLSLLFICSIDSSSPGPPYYFLLYTFTM